MPTYYSPDLASFRRFLAVAKFGSIGGAADAMGELQSTVTRSIQALERWAGKPLFTRMQRGTKLTDAGDALVPIARYFVDALNKFREHMGTSEPVSAAVKGRPRQGKAHHKRPLTTATATTDTAEVDQTLEEGTKPSPVSAGDQTARPEFRRIRYRMLQDDECHHFLPGESGINGLCCGLDTESPRFDLCPFHRTGSE